MPGAQNPADLGSRGVLASLVKNSTLSWEEPSLLTEDESNWPRHVIMEDVSEVEDEQKKTNVVMAVQREQNGVSKVMEIGRYGSLFRLLRVHRVRGCF